MTKVWFLSDKRLYLDYKHYPIGMIIDHIFIITLPHRKDRLDSITKQLDAFGLSYEVFYGVNGREMYYEHLKKSI